MNINSTVDDLLRNLVDLIALKGGVLLDQVSLVAHLRTGYEILGQEEDWWALDPETSVRIRAEELEFVFLVVLRQLGVIDDLLGPQELIMARLTEREITPDMSPPEQYRVLMKSLSLCLRMNEGEDPEGFGDLAPEVRRRFILNQAAPQHRTWDTAIRLADLFGSEEVPEGIIEGAQFDQRFVDYLAANPEQLENIHWRQFEHLCGEYFRRQGYEVEVTPPRGDGGIDVYARREEGAVGPELIVVQAKRLSGSNTVTIDEVKAFWTNLNESGATRAVIATTTRLEAGARTFLEGRKYRMTPAELDDVEGWVRQMRRAVD